MSARSPLPAEDPGPAPSPTTPTAGLACFEIVFLERRLPGATYDEELSQEFDQGVAEDEILAEGGLYSIGTVPGTTWKALVLIGSITTVAGVLFQLMIRGWIYPLPDYPTPLGATLLLAVPIAGVLILIAGVAVRARGKREPPLSPIV